MNTNRPTPQSDTLAFEWHEAKALTNLQKHGISFEEARSVFFDPNKLTMPDPSHSTPLEERLIDMGLSAKGRLLIVVYTERDQKIRIISCRKATPYEEKMYV